MFIVCVDKNESLNGFKYVYREELKTFDDVESAEMYASYIANICNVDESIYVKEI